MDTSSIFKFATIRNASDVVSTETDYVVQPSSPLVTALIAINENSSLSNDAKLTALNAALQSFIDSSSFLKTKSAFVASKSQSGDAAYYDQLYDNIVARTITKSTTNQIYKLVVEQMKAEHVLAKATTVPGMLPAKVKIVLPDGLLFSFLPHAPSTVGNPATTSELQNVVDSYQTYAALLQMIEEAKEEGVLEFHSSGNVLKLNQNTYAVLNEALGQKSMDYNDAQNRIDAQRHSLNTLSINDPTVVGAMNQVNRLEKLLEEASAEGITQFERTTIEPGMQYTSLTRTLNKSKLPIGTAEKLVNKKLQSISEQLLQFAPKETFSLIGDQWVNTTPLLSHGETVAPISDNNIMVYSHGCWLKFPFQIADLRVVEQQTVGYLPGEIAHINNTQPGELNTRVTRRLKRTEDFESIISEDEVSHETDSQSTEKFAMEKEASQVQSEESSWNVNASVSASYGPVSASVDGGYESSTSATNANSASQSYAKEVVQRVVDRVSKKVKSERSTKTIEEFEETVTHVIDNTLGDGPKSYVYRWLNKLSRATLKNYGKRLIFQIDVAHPSHYHVSRTVQDQPMLVLPQDPRTLSIGGIKIDHAYKVTRENYLSLADLYRVKIDAPPAERVVISKGFAKKGGERETKSIAIPKGYGAFMAKMKPFSWNQNFVIFVGPSHHAEEWWSGPEMLGVWTGTQDIYFNTFGGTPVTDNVDITVWNEVDYMVTFEVECKLTDETFKAWQVKAFQTITEAYQNLKEEAEAKMSEFNPNLPGLNPQQKLDLIRTELKKEALRKMFRCNPLGINDKYVVGKEYQSDCCTDQHNAEKVRFLETVFDWRNITYEFFPYFYGSRDVKNLQGQKVSDNWNEIQKLTDSDPHFQSFLQASYATIRIPVHRDSAKEIAAINFIMNNSIANFEVVPEGAQPLLDELENEAVTMFTTDITGEELPAPKETIDLGIFNLPTSLVILECGTQDGVKPIGFPESLDPPTSDVIIPKQFSPAIIADTCNP